MFAEGRVTPLKVGTVSVSIGILFFLSSLSSKRFLKRKDTKNVRDSYYKLANSLNSSFFSGFVFLNAVSLFLFNHGVEEDIVLLSIAYYIADLIFRWKVLEKEFLFHHFAFLLPS